MYFDNAATTPLLPEVKEEIIRFLDFYGNPSSKHDEGFIVRQKIEDIRQIVSNIFNGQPQNVIFTSSGSASNNLVIRGLKDSYIYYFTPTCHKSMRLACQSKKYNKEIQMTNDGLIDFQWLKKELSKYHMHKPVICYEVANSEIGVYQKARDIYSLVHFYNGLVVADITAYLPHIPSHSFDNVADYFTFSAHKLGALKGVGVVYINCHEELSPLIYGSQEHGLFGGTENVIGIISLGTALQHFNVSEKMKFNKISHYFQDLLLENIDDCYVIAGKCPNKIPQIMSVCFQNVKGEELVYLLNEKKYYISTGSACNSGSLEPSKTLKAIKICDKDIPCCVRISFSGEETKKDIENFVNELKQCVNTLRTFR